MPEAMATPAVERCLPAASVNTEMVTLLAVFDPLEESIVEGPAPFGQSNYVSGYPNEEIRWYGYHFCFRVVGSNSYYSLVILIYIVSFALIISLIFVYL